MAAPQGHDDRRFPPLPAAVDLPALEREVLARWRQSRVFERSLEQTQRGPRWIVYEGPPTANGRPGVHHVEARVFKDLFPRFKTMKGFHVPRRAGWDCHGLPVELQVEKELGFARKQDIEDYGIAEFNARCRESAQRHIGDFAAMTERMGYWVDLGDAYRTMDTPYIESVWWSLQQLFDRGLLVEDHRVTPYCPRDETPLSDHEVAQGYAEVVDPSVYVRMPLTSVPEDDGPWQDAHLLVWTTTPWTLVSNTAVAVHPEIDYALVRKDGELFVVASDLVATAVGADAQTLAVRKGADLQGWRYRRPFALLPEEPSAYRVVTAGHVTTDSGTGLVHLAPAFGAEDLAAAREHGLPLVNPIDASGRFRAEVPLVGGMFFKDADEPLIADLHERNLLHKQAPYPHSYPHCWRCDTRLIYYALPSWYVRTTAVKDRLLAVNERTDWHPAHLRQGRYGEWLRTNVDWALSRNRYWGTPLPVWRCTADPTHLMCVGSLAELSERAGRDLTGLDLHRPAVDEVILACAQCGAAARRVTEVIDVWYDSGAMPFAQWGAPHRNQAAFEAAFPAQYICEAIDQTRGWFYSLMAEGVLLFDQPAYETVLCLGLILDADGRRMSKHLGNIVDPFELFDRHGADAVRWLMLAGGSPWVDRRLSPEALAEVVRRLLLTLWHTASFFSLYAHAAHWLPPVTLPVGDRPLLDRWILADLQNTVAEVDAALETFDPAAAGRRIASFVDGLSNWYVRRSRRRFWRGDPAALTTLHECLETLVRLMAPFTPFLTDHLWQQLVVAVNPDAPDSVHLAAWPVADPQRADGELLEQMALVRRIVDAGRATRASAGLRTRQPLARAMVVAPGFAELPAELRDLIADELNVMTVEPQREELVDVAVKPNFRALGARFGGRTQLVASAIGAAGRPAGGQLVVEVEGEPVTLTGDELIVTETPRPGWAVTADGDMSVALDLTLTPELVRAGLLRDALRVVQEARKSAGLQVTDRIRLRWVATREDVASALRADAAGIAEETLASSVEEGDGEGHRFAHAELGLTVWIARA